MAAKTGAASLSAGIWRIFITPIDTVKTTLQVRNNNFVLEIGQRFLKEKRPLIKIYNKSMLSSFSKCRLKGNKHYHFLEQRSEHMEYWYVAQLLHKLVIHYRL